MQISRCLLSDFIRKIILIILILILFVCEIHFFEHPVWA